MPLQAALLHVSTFEPTTWCNPSRVSTAAAPYDQFTQTRDHMDTHLWSVIEYGIYIVIAAAYCSAAKPLTKPSDDSMKPSIGCIAEKD